MTGHAFKVGDRVRLNIAWASDKATGTVRALHNGYAWVEFDGDNKPESVKFEHLSPLSLISPAENQPHPSQDGAA